MDVSKENMSLRCWISVHMHALSSQSCTCVCMSIFCSLWKHMIAVYSSIQEDNVVQKIDYPAAIDNGSSNNDMNEEEVSSKNRMPINHGIFSECNDELCYRKGDCPCKNSLETLRIVKSCDLHGR